MNGRRYTAEVGKACMPKFDIPRDSNRIQLKLQNIAGTGKCTNKDLGDVGRGTEFQERH